jgi:ubiquinone/menaquinone biosynthesis C-methylase UbiE
MTPFIEKITPAAMRDRFKEISTQRPDLRVLLYMLGEKRMLEWIQTVGVCEDESLASFTLPFPPLELRQITAAPDLPEFLWTGLVDMDRIITLYEKVANHPNMESPTILDFGCGCGRMVRFLNNTSASKTIHACEVNPDHVGWCRDNLNNVKVSQCDVLPPLPYQDQMFDLIYGLSVFTHLSESHAAQWLSEMKRVLKRDGILIVTIHGLTALNTIKDSTLHQQMFNLNSELAGQTIEKFQKKPFVYFKYDQNTIELAKAGDEYGNAFIHPDYIYENWAKAGFKVLEVISGGLRNWQDIVILQRSA